MFHHGNTIFIKMQRDLNEKQDANAWQRVCVYFPLPPSPKHTRIDNTGQVSVSAVNSNLGTCGLVSFT